ncbi:MAG: serine hydrolase [Pseudomonadales bacterium]|nr:serine hydrolase [Pseudomonadales bacterium]MDP6471194.1 serine hydrolase [Pseudomonadales bacterium]MDP6825618.1 serine hydrolase [Pseudomonadales bacterium]MDP6970466.1 serine hydrolase [Pseudomonadales bacterium]
MSFAVAATDTDGDGISDDDEAWIGTDPLVADSDLDRDGDGLNNLEEILAGYSPLDANDPPRAASDGVQLAAAVLPISRSVRVGDMATVFAMLINAGSVDAHECRIVPNSPFSGEFAYQVTDPASNVPVGIRNHSVDIAAGAQQSFVLSLRPDIESEDVLDFAFRCTNAADATSIAGVNDLSLVSSAQLVPDVIALAATVQGDGIVHLDSADGIGAFAVATTNIGTTATIGVSVDTNGVSMPLALSLCRTDSASGHCAESSIPTPGPLSMEIGANTTATFGVFAASSAPVLMNAIAHRVFVRFRDLAGVSRGATSVAIERPRSVYENWSLESAAPAQVGMKDADVDAILDHVFTDQALQGAVLLKDGYVVGERYAGGYGASDLGTSWSVAKSFYAAAVGTALADGHIASLDDAVSVYVSAWRNTSRGDITIRQLLRMRAGMPGNENGCGNLFWEWSQTDYAISRTLVRMPGSAFQYSNCGSQVLEPLLLAATGMDAHNYLINRVLAPIGIDTGAVGLWSDRSGLNPMTYCCIDMSSRQFARFGLLMARRGEWDGERLLPVEFVDETLIAADAAAFYGLHWWILNENYFGVPVPVTLAAAIGLDGQWIIVWPEQDLVLVLLTRYAHPPAQGYVLSNSNFPDTCSARNTCPGATGDPVASFDRPGLVQLIYESVISDP